MEQMLFEYRKKSCAINDRSQINGLSVFVQRCRNDKCYPRSTLRIFFFFFSAQYRAMGTQVSSCVYDFFCRYLVMPGSFRWNWQNLFMCLSFAGQQSFGISFYIVPSLAPLDLFSTLRYALGGQCYELQLGCCFLFLVDFDQWDNSRRPGRPSFFLLDLRCQSYFVFCEQVTASIQWPSVPASYSYRSFWVLVTLYSPLQPRDDVAGTIPCCFP